MAIDDKVFNEKISKLSGFPLEVHEFQRIYNPLAFYGRLKRVYEILKIPEDILNHRANLYDKLYKVIMSEIKYYGKGKK